MTARARRPAEVRRGWCPGALRPMETGDGWLVRVHPPAGCLSIDDARRLAALARTTGNGLVDITARGNLQLRGVWPETHRPLVEALIAAGLADADEGEGPLRLTLVSPLAGRDPGEVANPLPLASAIESACRALAGLPAKALVVVDGGGMPLDDVAADLRLTATSPGAFALGLPDGIWLGALAPKAARLIVRDMLAALAEAHAGEPDRIRRLRDLPAAALAAIVARHGLRTLEPAPIRPPQPRAGIRAEHGGTFAVLAGAPFGRLDAATLDGVADIAAGHRAHDLRLTLWRGIALTGLAAPETALAALAHLGLITDPADPRLAVHACPGTPACSRGEAPAQRDAALLAAAAASRIAAGLSLHVSGCVKGCAHPGRAGLTLVGQGGGYGLVLDGTASDTAHGRFAADDIARMLAAPGDLTAQSIADAVSR